MPTLIRILVFLLILAGLAFGAMVGLTAVVDPGEREVRVRIAPQDLRMIDDSGAPTNLRQQLPSPTVTTQPDSPPASAGDQQAPAGDQPVPDMSTFG